jgi:hypothetical protein
VKNTLEKLFVFSIKLIQLSTKFLGSFEFGFGTQFMKKINIDPIVELKIKIYSKNSKVKMINLKLM